LVFQAKEKIMSSQSIDKTFVGTNDPASLEHSLSYYGASFPNADKTTVGSSNVIFDASKVFAWGESKVAAKLSTNIVAGIALPGWGLSTMVDGTIENDKMTIVVSEDDAVAGMFIGVVFDVNFTIDTQFWVPGHEHWSWGHSHWVSGYWHGLITKSIDIKYDLLPTCVDLVYSLSKKIPGFKKLVALMPQGLLDNMSVYNDGINNESGLRLSPNIPMKWDLLFIARQLAEIGVSAVSGPFVEIAVPIITVGEAMVSLEEEIGVCLGMGPQLEIVFPIKVKITKLVADDVVFEDLVFEGKTIIGTNPNGTLDIDTTPVQKIGYHCEQTLDLVSTSVGFWSSISALKVLSKSGSIDIDLIDKLQDILGFNLGLDSFYSSMTNTIGAQGNDEFGQRLDSIEVNFI